MVVVYEGRQQVIREPVVVYVARFEHRLMVRVLFRRVL